MAHDLFDIGDVFFQRDVLAVAWNGRVVRTEPDGHELVLRTRRREQSLREDQAVATGIAA